MVRMRMENPHQGQAQAVGFLFGLQVIFRADQIAVMAKAVFAVDWAVQECQALREQLFLV